jgi:hypothetical protein
LFGSANEHRCVHGAQINFGDLTPYLTYGGSASVEVYRRSCALQCAYIKCLIYYHIYGTVQQRQILKDLSGKKIRDEVGLVNVTIKWKTDPLFASYDLGLTLPPPPCDQREERVREREEE